MFQKVKKGGFMRSLRVFLPLRMGGEKKHTEEKITLTTLYCLTSMMAKATYIFVAARQDTVGSDSLRTTTHAHTFRYTTQQSLKG